MGEEYYRHSHDRNHIVPVQHKLVTCCWILKIERQMNIVHIIAGIVSLGLLFYLIAALIRPEKFG